MFSSLSNEFIQIKTSTTGAELLSVVCNGKEYIWQGDEKYWKYHAPILFPYVGRLYQSQYLYDGKIYPMTIHGFAMESEFSIIHISENSITYEFVDNAESNEIYPFHFALRVSYTLVLSKVEICYTVINCSGKIMHFGIGAHPGFNVPLDDDLGFTDYKIQLHADAIPDRIRFSNDVLLERSSERFLLDNGCICLNHDLFDNDAIVLTNTGCSAALVSDKGERSVTLEFPKMPYLGIWHANQTKAPYVCIEPWASLPSRENTIEDILCKSDLLHLEHGDTYNNKWSIEFK